jgi:hypothetical protein
VPRRIMLSRPVRREPRRIRPVIDVSLGMRVLFIVVSIPLRDRRLPDDMTPPIPVESGVVKPRLSDRKRSLGLLPVMWLFRLAHAIALRVRGPMIPSTGPGLQFACFSAVWSCVI